jgi:chromate reductase
MSSKKKILTICGSIKANSTNEALLRMLEEISADKCDFLKCPIERLPFFNPDLTDENIPTEVFDFRRQITEADAVIICTPEYVFSLPGVLKNALEWCVSSSSFSGKPVALIVAAAGGEKAFESLQLIMKTIEANCDESITLLIQGAKGKINSDETRSKLRSVINALCNTL